MTYERYYVVEGAPSERHAINAVTTIPPDGCRLERLKAKPVYGWNPLRRWFNWPKHYEVTATFTIEPEVADEPTI